MGMKRYSTQERRPGILQAMLGEEYEVIEEWLWWRTTMFDDPRPKFPERNGLKTLPIILETHLPLDYVIVMLWTTDTKEMMNITSEETTLWIEKIINTIQSYKTLEWTKPPKIILIVPPIVKEDVDFASKLFKWWTKKMKELIPLYQKIAQEKNILFIDSTKEVAVDKDDGIHIDTDNHKKLAELIIKFIK